MSSPLSVYEEALTLVRSSDAGAVAALEDLLARDQLAREAASASADTSTATKTTTSRTVNDDQSSSSSSSSVVRRRKAPIQDQINKSGDKSVRMLFFHWK